MQKRTLHELVNTNDPAWPLVQQWVANARNNVEVLPAQPEQAIEVLLYLQITTRSPMGAIALKKRNPCCRAFSTSYFSLRIMGSLS